MDRQNLILEVLNMTFNFMQLGKRIKEYRKHRGISQEKLADLVDLTQTYISLLEGGYKCMSLPTFVSIANALHVSADELLQDSLENTVRVSNHEFAVLVSDCSEYEKRVLLATLKSAKEAMRENKFLL